MEDKALETSVTTAVLSVLTSNSMKRNKLRKLVCNKFCEGVSWTDFQAVVDLLEGRGQLVQRDIGDGTYEVALNGPLTGGKDVSSPSKGDEGQPSLSKKKRTIGGTTGGTTGVSAPSPPRPPLDYSVKRTESIPTMVGRHLTKQNCKKKTNIESNTKTRLTIKGDFGENEGGTVELVIEGESDKRINAAMVFVEKFREAYKKNPDRFDPGMVRKREGEGGDRGGGKKKRADRKFY